VKHGKALSQEDLNSGEGAPAMARAGNANPKVGIYRSWTVSESKIDRFVSSAHYGKLHDARDSCKVLIGRCM
jgi:hypothetical protein